MSARPGKFGGFTVVAACAAFIAVALAVTFVVHGTGEPGLRSGVRLTARVGAVILSITFAASSLNALWRAGWSKWLLGNRRYLGLGFAVVHLVHAALFLTLAFRYTGSFLASATLTTLVGGSVGYAFLLAMIATSFDRSAAWLGRPAWTVLHTTGMYVLWAIFLFAYVGRAGQEAIFAVLTALLAAAFGLRVARWIRQRSRQARRGSKQTIRAEEAGSLQ